MTEPAPVCLRLSRLCRFLSAVCFTSDSGGRGGVTYSLSDDGRAFLGNDKVLRAVDYPHQFVLTCSPLTGSPACMKTSLFSTVGNTLA